MTRLLLSFFLFLILNSMAAAQNSPTEQAQPIVEEGKRLYRSEMASWYGTDVFLEKYTDHTAIGGYFSYTANDSAICIFFSKAAVPKVIGTITFDNTYNTAKAQLNLAPREFTGTEEILYRLRKNAAEVINTDTLFKTYNNTSLNLIPVISNGQRKVYVLTGPKQEGVVIFGNDYLLVFDDTNSLVSKKQLHKNIIAVNYGGEEEDGKAIEGTIHTHLPETGDFITATDICTLMLYERFAKWKQHNVISANFLNIWNCKTDELVVLPLSVVDKINKDQEKRNRKKKEE